LERRVRTLVAMLARLVPLFVLGAALALVPAGSPATDASGDRTLVHVGDFASPVYLTAPKSERNAFYVVEQAGRIVRVAGGRRTTFLDIRSLVLSGGEQGLLSVAFHPRYATTRLFYVDYTAKNGNTVIAEYRARGAKPLRTRVLMNLPDPASNHNGGLLVFGPDGYLWWGNGDGGGEGDQFGNGQKAGGYFSKIMRMDVDRRPARWSVWAVGLRNPWRFSFDRDGSLYIADVGQNEWEEVDWVPRGASHLNFGWDRYEGKADYGDEQLLPGWKLTAPVYVYDHGEGCSITGGYVYRGPNVPSAVGRYFFGDYCNGKVWSLRMAGGKATGVERESFSVPDLSSFGEDAAGRLYLLSLSGPVFRLAAG
jgi:glucose/arabinose dehydrogenase